MLTSKKKSEKNLHKQKNLLKLQTTNNLIEQSEDCVRMFYESIGQQPEYKSRDFEYAMPRIAIGVAIAKRVGKTIAAKVMRKHRTTIHHHVMEHDTNIKGWDGYALFYETADYTVNSYMDNISHVNRMRYLDTMIQQFTKEKNKIQSNIHV